MRKVVLVTWILFAYCAITGAAYLPRSTTSMSKISRILANFKASSASLGFDLICAIDCSPYAALNKTQGIRFAMPEARIHQCLSDNKYDVSQPPIIRVDGSVQPIIITIAIFMTTLVSFEGEIIAFDYSFLYFWNDAYRYDS